MQGNINNCINSGNINGANSTVAGIVGWAYRNCTIEDCYNSGNIESKYRAAGISGSIGKNSKANNCENTGNIVGTLMLTGGITGQLDILCEISNCNNKGKIVGVQYVSGIIGYSYNSNNIEKCINTGMVEGTDKYTGGIIGVIVTDSNDPSSAQIAKVQKNCNIGRIKGNKYTGGIVGCVSQYGTVIEKCYNTKEVEGTENVGGITGYLARSSKVNNCYNIGNITGSNYIGGISGGTYYSACQITNCYNTGNITGQTIIGGIIGKNENESITDNSYYLTGTALLDSGNIQESNLSKNKEYIITTFVTQANNEDIIWIVNSNQNEGYPVLKMD